MLEVAVGSEADVIEMYRMHGVSASVIGKGNSNRAVEVCVAGSPAVSGDVAELRDVWEETSFTLERLQCAEDCVTQEQAGLRDAKAPKWVLPFTPAFTPAEKLAASDKVRVAILREEGSNGDREMGAAAYAAGMEPWDITMSDLINGRASLDTFQVRALGGAQGRACWDGAGWVARCKHNFFEIPRTSSLLLLFVLV